MRRQASTQRLVERLEPRWLLASFTWNEGVVSIVGTEQNDSLLFRADGSDYVLEGHELRVPQAQVEQLVVELLGGNDEFRNDSNLPMTIHGGAGDDRIFGGAANDSLYGEVGSDYLHGGAGDDQLDGGGQVTDRLVGGDGLDSIVGVTLQVNGRRVTITGSLSGDEIIVREVDGFTEIDGAGQRLAGKLLALDVLLGTGDDWFENQSSARSTATGADGDDVLIGSAAAEDRLYGGNGNDILRSGGTNRQDELVGNEGTDWLDDSNQIDRLQWRSQTLRLYAIDSAATIIINSTETKVYLPRSETYWDRPSILEVYGGNGDDRIINRSSLPARLYGRLGDDLLIAGTSGDILVGDEGNDVLFGGADNDQLDGSKGHDRMAGSGGDDTYRLWTNYSAFDHDSVTDPAGTDTLDFNWAGSSSFVVLTFTGTRGKASGPNKALTVSSQAAEIIIGTTASDTIQASRDTLRIDGSLGNDTLSASAAGQTLIGNYGNDVLRGHNGNDQLFGGVGNDLLDGGAGDDTFVFEGSTAGEIDQLLDAAGHNTLDFRLTQRGVRIDASAATGFASDGLRQVNRTMLQTNGLFTAIYGSPADDVIKAFGTAGARIFAGEGRNTVTGSDGDDYIESGLGADILSGSLGNDVISGDGGDDVISGGLGNDEIFGGAGNDSLDGGEGSDLIDGALGNDAFLFGTPALTGEYDRIQDSAGVNTLDFRTNLLGVRIDAAATLGIAVDARRTVERVLQSTNGVFTTIYGGAGDDVILADPSIGARIETGAGTNQVIGTPFADYIMGGNGGDSITAHGGDDIVFAREGDDVITGGDGNDTLVGGLGRDHLSGGAGADQLIGGDPGSCDGILVPYTVSREDSDDILLGELGDDTLVGGPGYDELDGGPGKDEMWLHERYYLYVADNERPEFG